jgi:integrase
MAVFKLKQGGRCKCGAGAESPNCKCPEADVYTFSFRFRGKQYTRRTDATKEADAKKLEASYLKLCRSQSLETQMAVLKHLNSDESRKRRVSASIGEVIDAYMAKAHLWLSPMTARRNAGDLLLLFAFALDLWVVNEGGRKGIKVGARVPDEAKIRALSCGRLDAALVKAYFMARQSSMGVVADDVVEDESERHVGFNGTLKHVRDMFGKKAMEKAFADLSLPDLTGFFEVDLLPEEEQLPEPFSIEEFAALCEKFDGLKETEPDLWLLNLIHRQTGLRPRYVMGLRGTWLKQGDAGVWSIEVKSRPEEGFGKKKGKNGRTRNQYIPVTEELRAAIAAKGEGLTVGGQMTKTGREDLQKRHNAIIKQIVGNEGSHGQASYRYRDTTACVLGFLYGLDAAQKALGHVTSLTTLKHYCRDLLGVSDRMRGELSAWLNLPSIKRRQ